MSHKTPELQTLRKQNQSLKLQNSQLIKALFLLQQKLSKQTAQKNQYVKLYRQLIYGSHNVTEEMCLAPPQESGSEMRDRRPREDGDGELIGLRVPEEKLQEKQETSFMCGGEGIPGVEGRECAVVSNAEFMKKTSINCQIKPSNSDQKLKTLKQTRVEEQTKSTECLSQAIIPPISRQIKKRNSYFQKIVDGTLCGTSIHNPIGTSSTMGS